LTVFNFEPLSPVEDQLFTPREMKKALKMGPRRRKSFTAARVALKALSRRLSLVEENRPDRAIETVGSDDQKPCLAESGLFCSVSHNDRFVVAAAHKYPIGVDIEAVSSKVMRIRHLFLSPREQRLASQSGLDVEKTATRVWTIKEAAAKALGLHLFQTIQEVEVVCLDKEEGLINYQNRTYHVTLGEGYGQVIALLTVMTIHNTSERKELISARFGVGSF
jgi:phosphopantetheinyl transferase